MIHKGRELGVLTAACSECRWTVAGDDVRVEQAARRHEAAHRGRQAEREHVSRLWEEHGKLTAAGDRDGARDAADVAIRKEEWLSAHPGLDRVPCANCSQEGTVPFEVPELGRTVWRCAHHAAAERARQAAEDERNLLAGMTPAEVGAYRADHAAAADAAALEQEREPRDEEQFDGAAYARHLGGHVHTRVFVGPRGRTRARAGVLITREGPETDWLLLALECGGLEVHHERTEG